MIKREKSRDEFDQTPRRGMDLSCPKGKERERDQFGGGKRGEKKLQVRPPSQLRGAVLHRFFKGRRS